MGQIVEGLEGPTSVGHERTVMDVARDIQALLARVPGSVLAFPPVPIPYEVEPGYAGAGDMGKTGVLVVIETPGDAN